MPNLDDYEQTEDVSENELDAWVKPGGKRVFVNRHPDNVAHAENLKWIRESELNELKAAKANEPNEDGLDSLRDEYLKVVGKKPHHKAGKESMEEAITKANEGGE